MFSRRAILRSLLALPLASLFVKKTEAKEVSSHVSTGIPALDNALGGGFPRGKVTSVTVYNKFHLDALFIKHGAKLFGGEYGEHYVSVHSAFWITEEGSYRLVRQIDKSSKVSEVFPVTPVKEVYKACDAALAANEAVVFMTSRNPMVCQNLYERQADVYVVFGFDKPTHLAECRSIEQFSVLTATKKF